MYNYVIIGVLALKTVEERLREYEPLWENWTYTGNFLGEGAMSSVFEIESTAMGLREVAALKIITVKKDINGEVKIPKTALNEIKILRALSGCPNIINYHDSTQRKIYDEDKNLESIDLLIKMEELQSLSEGKKLDEKEVVKLAKDICTALIYASKHGVIHRDIKPQNIFVDDDGIYKLGDFGIAKIVSEFSQHYTMNIGTMAYTAPEICNGKSTKYDITSDIYSLGLVLYVFLNNGYLPFMNSTSSVNDAIAKRFSGAIFPSPENGSKALKRIVMRACNADAEKRYKTPQEMLDDLQSLSSGGKKMIVDPFATLDANIDVAEFIDSGAIVAKEKTSDSVADMGTAGKKKSGRLIFSMGKSSAGKSSTAATGSFSDAGELKTTVVSSVGGVKADVKAVERKTDATITDATVYMGERSASSDVGYSREEKVDYNAGTVYMTPPGSGSGHEIKSALGTGAPGLSKSATGTGGLRINMGSKTSGTKSDVNKDEKEAEVSKFFKAPPSL